jgi:hypothetical protein
MLNVQEYLLAHSLNDLKRNYGVTNSCKSGNYFFSLNYDQIESKPGPLTNECRGLILSVNPATPINSADQVVGKTLVLARPMNRFFNYGDSNAHEINFADPQLTYFEKLDGTLCILYWNPWENKWNVATRSVPTANMPIDGFGEHTFRTLFEKALFETLVANGVLKSRSVGYSTQNNFDFYTSQLDKHATYCFELTTPLNRVVVEYKEFRVHVLAILDTHSGQEAWPGYPVPTELHGVPWCPAHQIQGIKDLLDFVSSKNPLEHEGVVVRDKNGNRVKVKNAAYLAYNRAKNILANSPRALMELILLEKIDDVAPLLTPQLQEYAAKMANSLKNMIQCTNATYTICEETAAAHKDNPRKYFAIQVQALKGWMSPLMNRYTGKCADTKDYIMKQRLPDNTWSDSFLETLVDECKKYG